MSDPVNHLEIYRRICQPLNERTPGYLPSENHVNLNAHLKTTYPSLFSVLTSNPKFIDDITRYPAAASALLYILEITHEPERVTLLFSQWRNLYAYHRKPTRPLNLTLDQASHQTPHTLLKSLSGLPLRHALTHPARLNLALTLPQLISGAAGAQVINMHHLLYLLYHTDDDDLAEMRHLINDYNHHQHTFTNLNDLRFMVTLLRDGMLGTERTLTNAARNSIRAHRGNNAAAIQRMVKQMNLTTDTPVAKPHETPPEDPHIRLLTTVGEILEEGRTMGHCVGGYAPNAILGKSLILHAEYDGEHATFEINPTQRRIVQYAGPHNTRTNKAITYATPILMAWAARINPLKLIIPDIETTTNS